MKSGRRKVGEEITASMFPKRSILCSWSVNVNQILDTIGIAFGAVETFPSETNACPGNIIQISGRDEQEAVLLATHNYFYLFRVILGNFRVLAEYPLEVVCTNCRWIRHL